MSWSRPVPLVGDRTSARERAGDPRAWAFTDTQRAALYEVIGARRDIRRFRPDQVPDDLVRRVLAAAHSAPSVGHSQPWRFVTVRDPSTRERAAVLADRERLAQAAQLDPESGRRLLDLQLEGIREAPLGVVVCCDRRTAAAGVLGRNTFPDADLWSCACAIENLWLAARAEGLGVGWVTLFRPADLAELLALPDGVVTLGWLCLGWPDERPPAPGLERAGWSRRTPLDDVILHERWPDGLDQSVPVRPRSHLRSPGPHAVVGVRDAADDLLTPPGSLGVLDRTLDRLLALDKQGLAPGTLVLVGADHPVAGLGVSAYPRSVSADVLAAAVCGEAIGVAAARSAGMRAVVVDAGVGDRRVPGAVDAGPHDLVGDLVDSDALTNLDVERLVAVGRQVGAAAAVDGPVALGEVGIGNTTVAAALAAVLLDRDPRETVGLGAGADAAILSRKIDVTGAALARARRDHGDSLGDPLVMVQALGGAEIAVLTGVTLGAAAAGAAVVMDGLVTSVAALLAVRIEAGVAAHLVAGHRSRELAHQLVLAELGQEPLLDLRIRSGEGVGACLALTLLRAADQTRRSTATTS